MTASEINHSLRDIYFDHSTPTPDFCHDIAQALSVWAKLRDSGRFCCLQIDSDYHYVWGCKLIEVSSGDGHEPTIHVEVVSADSKTLKESMDALCLCICAAALQAAGKDISDLREVTDLIAVRRKPEQKH